MNLPIRYPQIDFEACFPHWAPDREFSMSMNASSILPAYLEPYIIKAFAEARKLLDPARDAELIREVDWFIAQESQHYRQHARFNRVFETARYPEVVKIGRAYGAVLDDFLKKRSLIFNLAYTEGFESGGAVFYRVWFEKLRDYRIGAKDEVLRLWDWHYAEEFEHREVAFKLYMAIAARGNIFRRVWHGYFYRIYGVIKMLTDSGKVQRALAQHMLDVDRQDMTPEERAASEANQKKGSRRITGLTVFGLLGVLSPIYDPARKPPPAGLDVLLKDFEMGGPFSRKLAK